MNPHSTIELTELEAESLYDIMMSNLSHELYPLENSLEDYNDSWAYYDNYDKFIDAAYLINEYYLWVIFAIGFPGNIATLITICRMRRLGPFAVYVALLAIADNLAISVKLLFYQLLSKKVNVGTAGCRLLQFNGNFLMTYCNWILVLMAVERLIAVKFPFKIQFQSCLSSRKAGAILFGMGIVIAGTYFPILLTSTYYETKHMCIPSDPGLANFIHWSSVILYAIIPFIVLVVCNILIVRGIRLSFRLRSAFRSINSFMMQKRCCDVPIQRQIMFMLFTTTFMFLVLHVPICAMSVADYYWAVEEYSTVKYLCFQLAYVLCDSNHAMNFYLYFFSARKFRSHFVNLFRCSKNGRKNRSRVAL